MAQHVCNGALIQCSFGTMPSALMATGEGRVNASKMAAATITDNVAIKNVKSFGMCTTVTNPQVAAATSAAMGVLTPQPCMPVTPAPWTPGSPTVLIGGKPALNPSSQLMCMWGGVITINNPGQGTVNVP